MTSKCLIASGMARALAAPQYQPLGELVGREACATIAANALSLRLAQRNVSSNFVLDVVLFVFGTDWEKEEEMHLDFELNGTLWRPLGLILALTFAVGLSA